MKNCFFTTLFIAFLSGLGYSQCEIGYVDSKKLFDSLPSRKMAIEEIKQLEEAGYLELNQIQKELEFGYSHSQTHNLTPDRSKKQQNKLDSLVKLLEVRQLSLQQELILYEKELNKPIMERIQRAIEIVAERKKLNFIMDESALLYFQQGTDCTAEVLVELLRLDAEAMK